ncbi:hypothetical protein [Mycoplasma sp. 4044]
MRKNKKLFNIFAVSTLSLTAFMPLAAISCVETNNKDTKNPVQQKSLSERIAENLSLVTSDTQSEQKTKDWLQNGAARNLLELKYDQEKKLFYYTTEITENNVKKLINRELVKLASDFEVPANTTLKAAVAIDLAKNKLLFEVSAEEGQKGTFEINDVKPSASTASIPNADLRAKDDTLEYLTLDSRSKTNPTYFVPLQAPTIKEGINLVPSNENLELLNKFKDLRQLVIDTFFEPLTNVIGTNKKTRQNTFTSKWGLLGKTQSVITTAVISRIDYAIYTARMSEDIYNNLFGDPSKDYNDFRNTMDPEQQINYTYLKQKLEQMNNSGNL